MQHIPNIKSHPWFSTVDWEKLIRKEVKPLFVPIIHSESDVSHFDKEFTACSIESHASSFGDDKLFEGFSYEHRKSPASPEMGKMEMENELDKSDSDGEIVFTLESKMETE